MKNIISLRYDSILAPHNEEFHRLFRLKAFDLSQDTNDAFRIEFQDEVARWVRKEINGRLMFMDNINYWTTDNGTHHFSDLSITLIFTSETDLILFKLMWM